MNEYHGKNGAHLMETSPTQGVSFLTSIFCLGRKGNSFYLLRKIQIFHIHVMSILIQNLSSASLGIFSATDLSGVGNLLLTSEFRRVPPQILLSVTAYISP